MFFVIFSFTLALALAFLLKRNIKNLRQQSDKKNRFNSLPIHFAYCFMLWALIFGAMIWFSSFSNNIKYFLIASYLSGLFILLKIFYEKNFNAKKHIEGAGKLMLSSTAGIGILITIVITISILFESIKFFELVNPFEFLFGTRWNPQMAMTTEQSVSSSSFGAIPVFLGTLVITVVAMMVAIPCGIMAAVYLCLYARKTTRDLLKPILEILAGVPTVVYGYFAVTAVAPFFKSLFLHFGINIASESALAAGFVMGVMIIPFVLSLTDDALATVPQSLKDGALAMGSTKSEMIRKVILPAATPSIVGAIILAVSRAVGETMIVTMAAGLIANMTINPLNSVTTATAQIVTLLVGDQEFNNPKTLAAFALALVLFILTFAFNVIALAVIKNYKKKYG